VAGALVAPRIADLPQDVVELAKQCILDTLGVAIAGASEPLVDLLVQDSEEQGASSACSLIGRCERSSLYQAALVNGAAAHALDYDDVNLAMIGHPSAAILPALLALGETRATSGRELIEAFVAGYEAMCQIGSVLAEEHYARGFHCTATLGTFGAAAACARLLGLDRNQAATALGIAGTQAAGLKAMFGTMCKPLHAGTANQHGLRAALLAKRGFTSRPDVLECAQGFAATQCDPLAAAARAPAQEEFHIRRNLFKYHAACYNTHAAIDALQALTGRAPVAPEEIEQVVVRADAALDKVCNIASPRTGLEAKFSLRLTAAFALAGLDTSRLDTYSDANAADPRLIALRDKVRVELVRAESTVIDVEIVRRGGRRQQARHDSSLPASDLARQGARLREKFAGLVGPVLGQANADRLLERLAGLESLPSVTTLARAAARP
jgi:2-methylcitrate dehydratase PrpD